MNTNKSWKANHKPDPGIFLGLLLITLMGLPALSFAQASQTPVAKTESGNVKVHHAHPQLVLEETYLSDWDPFMEMQRMHEAMNNMFIESMKRLHTSSSLQELPRGQQSYAPNLDFKDTGDSYALKMDLPGMEKEKINLEVTRDSLRVAGERYEDNEEVNQDEQYFHRERSYGRFERVIPLPQDANLAEVQAVYEGGILTITLPKLPSEQVADAPRKVAIN